MNKIRVIKKDVTSKANGQDNAVEERNVLANSKGRDAVKTVQHWIAKWHSRTETETRRASGELGNLKLKNSNGRQIF